MGLTLSRAGNIRKCFCLLLICNSLSVAPSVRESVRSFCAQVGVISKMQIASWITLIHKWTFLVEWEVSNTDKPSASTGAGMSRATHVSASVACFSLVQAIMLAHEQRIPLIAECVLSAEESNKSVSFAVYIFCYFVLDRRWYVISFDREINKRPNLANRPRIKRVSCLLFGPARALPPASARAIHQL